MTPVTANATVQRRADGQLWFKPKANLNNPTAIDMSGSSFELDIYDLTGTPLLSLTIGTPTDGVIRFSLTPDQTAALPAGPSSLFNVTRITSEAREVWITGTLTAQGIVNG